MNGDEGDRSPGGLASAWRVITLVVMALLGAGVLAALIISQGEANRQRDKALALQTHSFEVMILARTLSGTIARSEASLGRYVISGDDKLGQLYFDQWRLADQQIDRLDQITGDKQQPRIDALRRAFAIRGNELSLTALATAYRKNDQALARYYKARQSAALADIDARLNAIIAAEHAVLARRTAEAMRSVASSTAAAHVFSVFGVIIALGAMALGWLTLQAQAERTLARQEADEERLRAIELEAAVTAATDELRLQEAKIRQIHKMDAVGQLTGGIAHDFNNMLAVVLGGLELAKRHAAIDSAVHRHIDSAAEGAHRAAALTRRLLAFSREEPFHAAAIDPGTLIAGMRDLIDRTLGDQITVDIKVQAHGWLVFADRIALENAVVNLAVNARDAMGGRGHLTIATGNATLDEQAIGQCVAGDYVTLSVADTGCGMSPEVIERAFEPFFTTKPVGKGTGLGLSQIFAMVRQIGGDIGIVSQPGQGTVVTLYLPRHAAAAALVAAPEPRTSLPSADTGSLAILVVEDDPRVLASTIGALEELGHHPIACDDPLAAPLLLAQHPDIEMVVSDVLMPGQTGPEMIAGLIRHHPHLAVLFVTGYAGDALGLDDVANWPVLRKPFTLTGLERAIDAVVAEQRQMPEQIAAE